MSKKIIAVIGASGLQGGGVVSALKQHTDFAVRAVTRNPEKYQGKADDVVKADLSDAASVEAALRGVYGVFAVTNFWDPSCNETAGKQLDCCRQDQLGAALCVELAAKR